MNDQPVVLAINPDLDVARYAAIYQAEGVVQIPDVFETRTAQLITMMLEEGVDWQVIASGEDGRGQSWTRPEMGRLNETALNARLGPVLKRASEGFAFLYFGYPMIAARLEGRDLGHPIHDLTEFLNGSEFLDFGRAVTGEASVVKADAQATFYRRGDFLTMHDDRGDDERRAAYTLGFTRQWRADWGGQLLFHAENGEIERGFQPGFNVLTFFKVPTLHSVAAVAPYAAAPRLSIVGWLRDDLPQGAR